MKISAYLSIIPISLLMASCTTTSKTFNIMPKSGTSTHGSAKFMEENKMVEMNINVTGLTPGEHAVHIHEFGDCSSPDAKSAGGHWNPSGEIHGKWNVDQFHMGDIGNLVADKSGNAKLTFKTDKWCMTCEDDKKNIMGKSIVIHAAEDDFKSQPSGNAGGRIGCIEIK